MFLMEPIRSWYGRFERPISSLSLIGGFVFDAVTLKRVDTIFENLWILGHLLIIAVFIILIHTKESEQGDETNPTKKHFWYVNILQFFFGGTLSVYLVFYFRSADIFVAWPFILMLVLAFWANESLKRHYVRFSFQVTLFFLSVYSFAIFLVPVVLHRIGVVVFLISGVLSLLFITIFIAILFHFVKEKLNHDEYEGKRMIIFLIAGIFLLVNFLYFTNLIPPIPLSLKDAGVYHLVEKNVDGNYYVSVEDKDWKQYFKFYPDFKKMPQDPVYVFSAIFSPKGLDLTIVHEWQHYDEATRKWIDNGKVNLPVVGGRDGGFRTYSMASNLAPGKWRVNIKTQKGEMIGHLRFNVVETDTEPLLETTIK